MISIEDALFCFLFNKLFNTTGLFVILLEFEFALGILGILYGKIECAGGFVDHFDENTFTMHCHNLGLLNSSVSSFLHHFKGAIDAEFVDDAHAFSRYSQTNETVLACNPKALLVEVDVKTSVGLVVGMRDVVPLHWLFTCYFTNLGHEYPSKVNLTSRAMDYTRRRIK